MFHVLSSLLFQVRPRYVHFGERTQQGFRGERGCYVAFGDQAGGQIGQAVLLFACQQL
jgi:hypothetical protein